MKTFNTSVCAAFLKFNNKSLGSNLFLHKSFTPLHMFQYASVFLSGKNKILMVRRIHYCAHVWCTADENVLEKYEKYRSLNSHLQFSIRWVMFNEQVKKIIPLSMKLIEVEMFCSCFHIQVTCLFQSFLVAFWLIRK